MSKLITHIRVIQMLFIQKIMDKFKLIIQTLDKYITLKITERRCGNDGKFSSERKLQLFKLKNKTFLYFALLELR